MVDNDERWLIIRNHDPEIEPVELFTAEWTLEFARRAVGEPAVPPILADPGQPHLC